MMKKKNVVGMKRGGKMKKKSVVKKRGGGMIKKMRGGGMARPGKARKGMYKWLPRIQPHLI